MSVHLRSALFLIWFLAISVIMHIVLLPLLLAPRSATVRAAKTWSQAVLFGLKHIANLGMEVRGSLPVGPVLIAAKHFSMWETIALVAMLRDPSIVLKRELLWIPFYGWFAAKHDMIPIDRAAGAKAVRRMQAAAQRAAAAARPIIIFPEGTRKKPGAPLDYKPGTAALYALLGLPCVPTAHNSGLFWHGWFLRKPGTVVVEFLEPIAPGLPRREFMFELQTRIEGATYRLLHETT